MPVGTAEDCSMPHSFLLSSVAVELDTLHLESLHD